MPELPEVETVVRSLKPKLAGRKIVEVATRTRKPWAKAAARLAGRTIRAVGRRGKYILLELDQGVGAIHLGMTGRLLWRAGEGPYTRAVLRLDQGWLVFDDVRQFGFVRWQQGPPEQLGPDALEVTPEEFTARLARRKGRLKALLLNQRFISGVGNIYADEALFRARIHPLAQAHRLSRRRALRLYEAVLEVLTEAVAAGGSTISNYADGEGRPGWFQFQHRVYQRAGQPCLQCGAAIRRILVSQRGTHYCPKCQR